MGETSHGNVVVDGNLRLTDACVYTEALEINAAWHCNIKCAWCSHASPDAQKKYSERDHVKNSLTQLAAWMTVDHVRILGGEPLLHPHLVDLMDDIRGSGITEKIRIVTNGVALHQVGSDFWQAADEVHISVYPNTLRHIESRLQELQKQAADAQTMLILNYYDHFRIAYRDEDGDDALTQRVYKTCQIGNLWRCLTVEEGRLYRCPQSAYLHIKGGERQARGSAVDYLEISEISSAAEVLGWLQQKSALDGCRLCAGSVGIRQRHRQLGIRTSEPPVAVDLEYLKVLETDITASNSCVSKKRVLWQGVR
jgi:uncharacterized Fe-S cluster-containing radical SAM superfamily protein